jgi:hypothetical protein
MWWAHNATPAARARHKTSSTLSRQLLLTPGWLEQKMHWHGPSSVVKDFHVALQLDPSFLPTAKILLQAFKMSEATALAMPHTGMLCAQMLARTQAVSSLSTGLVDEAFQAWWMQQVCIFLVAWFSSWCSRS